VDREARQWTAPRIVIATLVLSLLVIDCYAMYAGWFGWDRGGMHGQNPVVENWDSRSGRGVLIAAPLVLTLGFVVVGWPRVFGRIRVERKEIRRGMDRHRMSHSWD
jgi:hypothetical protein